MTHRWFLPFALALPVVLTACVERPNGLQIQQSMCKIVRFTEYAVEGQVVDWKESYRRTNITGYDNSYVFTPVTIDVWRVHDGVPPVSTGELKLLFPGRFESDTRHMQGQLELGGEKTDGYLFGKNIDGHDLLVGQGFFWREDGEIRNAGKYFYGGVPESEFLAEEASARQMTTCPEDGFTDP